MASQMQSPRELGQRQHGASELGFTLIELMIGVLIGALSTLVIAKVFAFSEGQRRATAYGSDAQVNGALALYAIQRDAQMSGYGITQSLDVLGCVVKANFNGVNLPGWTLAPVLITDGPGDAPDSVRFLGSAVNSYSVPNRIWADHPKTASTFFASTTIGTSPGDLMIAVPATIDASNWCSVFNVTGLGGANQVIHASGSDGPWNPSGAQAIFPDDGYRAGSYLLNLGTLNDRTYSISANNALQLTSFDSVTATSSTAEVFPSIVQLQAFYGKDTDGDGVVDTYDKVLPTTNAGWRQVIAVRIALVARSSQFEKEAVTASNPQWDVGTAVPVAGSVSCGAGKCITLKVDTTADWNRHRYKVYDVVVPLRNLIWHA